MPLVTHEAVDPVGGQAAQIAAVEVEIVAPGPAPRVFRLSDGAEVRPREVLALTPGPTGYPATWSLQLASQASLEPADTIYVIRQHFVTDQGIVVTEDRAQVPDGAGPYKLRDCLTLNPGTPGIVVGWTPAGWWDTETLYRLREVVGHAGQSYVARRDNAGIEPGTDASVWQLVGTVQPSSFPAPATSSTLGSVQLAGDFGGSASAPKVPTKLGPIVDVAAAPYGATGNGTSDDRAAIQAAIDACPRGGIVWLPTPSGGSYRVGNTLDLPPNITLRAQHGDTLVYSGADPSPNSIKPLATFPANTPVLRARGKSLTGASVDHVGLRIENVTIDGTAAPNAGIQGVRLAGLVREVTCENVTVNRVTGTGFEVGDATGAAPQSLRFRGCVTHDVGGYGFAFSNCPDTTLVDCNAQGSVLVGFYLAGMPNSFLIGCRAEWSGQHGFYLTSGLWGTGQGSGGIDLVGCLTDRNNWDGVYINATGNAPIGLTGCVHRRDGRIGGTTQAGVRVISSTMPVVADGMKVYPGVNDDGAGTLSPYAAISATNSTSVVVQSGYLHAATVSIVDGGGNGALLVSPTVGQATGPSASPTRTAPVGVVPASQRGPIGGTSLLTYAATVTPNAANSSAIRVVATGNLTVNPPSGGAFGQLLMLEVGADGADGANRTVTLAAGIVLSTGTTRTFTVTSGQVGYFGMRYSPGLNAWVLLAQTQTIAG